jgi:pyruvate, water dikinase
MLQFVDGEVLVIQQSLPVFAVLLDRAAAVIAEYGSISSHLANVAREYHTPALFGVEGATARLADGQTVTVDADGMKVYEGKAALLLQQRPKPPHVMADTPVYNTLKQVMPHIAPLTLLDPDAPTFSPAHCTSLHDIIRYCHEKAVHEMFEFGRKNAFPIRSSKQLVVNVPMQWWILNLDDGFTEEVEGPKCDWRTSPPFPCVPCGRGSPRYPGKDRRPSTARVSCP